ERFAVFRPGGAVDAAQGGAGSWQEDREFRGARARRRRRGDRYYHAKRLSGNHVGWGQMAQGEHPALDRSGRVGRAFRHGISSRMIRMIQSSLQKKHFHITMFWRNSWQPIGSIA